MKCDSCGQNKEDVYERVDPYQLEVNHAEILRDLCNDCEAELREAI